MKGVSIMKHILQSILILFFSMNLFAGQENDTLFIEGEKKLEQAYYQWSEKGLLESRAYFQRLSEISGRKWLALYYTGLCDYRLSHYYQQKDDKEKAEQYNSEGIEILEKSIEEKDDFSDSQVLLASLYGSYIGFHPVKGMFIGPKINSAYKKAYQLSPENYRVFLLDGIGTLFKPSMFGGGTEEALEIMLKGLPFLEKESSTLLPSWGKAEYHAWLGYIYLKNGNKKEAEKSFLTALKIEPEYQWVSKHLIKQIEN